MTDSRRLGALCAPGAPAAGLRSAGSRPAEDGDSRRVSVELASLAVTVKEGLLAFAVGVGLQVFRTHAATRSAPRHLEAARAAWADIGRADLVADLDAEFARLNPGGD